MFLCSCGQIFKEKLKISCHNIFHIFYPFIALCDVLTLDLAKAALLSRSSNKARLNICEYIWTLYSYWKGNSTYGTCVSFMHIVYRMALVLFSSHNITDIILTTGSYETCKGCGVRKRRHLDITCEDRWRRTVWILSP